MPIVYRAANLIDANLVADALEAAGLPCRIQGASLAGAVGELPPDELVTVWVDRAQDVERARRLIRDIEFDRRRDAPDRYCRRCREANPHSFDLCWQCGQPIE